MNAIENQVRQLVDVELAAANERFPQFHSAHEGWAIIKEEVEELASATGNVEDQIEYLWEEIRTDLDGTPYVKSVFERAIDAACEAIQVAAMCKKFLEMENGDDQHRD